MRKSIRQLIIVLNILFVIPQSLKAQENGEKQKLTIIIAQIQQQFDVQFNYAEAIIKQLEIIPPKKNLNLKETIRYLESKTNLNFNYLDETLIIIKQKRGFVFCGYIKDFENNNVLTSATIKGAKNATISNEYGYFELTIANKQEPIEIRHLGFETITKPYSQFKTKNCGAIYLQPSYNSISEIVISNYIAKGITKLNDGSFKIDFSHFEILPGLIDNDVLQSIQSFPGIISVNETVSNINIRGGTHDQNLILWDGIKMYQSGHFFGLISMFNPEITQKVSLQKNGTDASFSDGVSGTIDMQTSKKINSKFKANIGLNLTDINGFADVPIGENSSLQIAARKSLSNFFETPTYNEFFDRISQNTEVESNAETIINSDKKFDFNDASIRWNYNLSKKDHLRFSFITVSNKLEFNENAMINLNEVARKSKISQNSIAESISYHRNWNRKLQTTIEIYETDYKLKAVNANILNSQRFLQENSVSETSAKFKINYQLNPKLTILSGYHFTETGINNLDDIDTPIYHLLVAEVIRNHGVFSELKLHTTDTNLNLGIRYNYIDKFNRIIWEPRLSFNQRFLQHFTFELLGEFKHQITSQVINFQNDFLGIEKRRWQLANNETIPIITSKQFSAGLNYNHHNWLLSVESYYKNIDGITSQSQGFQDQYEFTKTNGNYTVLGIDLLLRKQVNRLNTWFSYSYMDNKYDFKNLETSSFPSNYQIKHSITLGTTYANKHLKISTGFNWHSGKPTTQPISENEITNEQINYGATNAKNLSDYVRLDFSALYYFKMGNKTTANIGASVWNVLNKENEISNFYSINNNVVEEIKQHSLGITPNLLFKVRF